MTSEHVSEADKTKVPSDFEEGDIVAFFVDGVADCGVVKTSTETELTIFDRDANKFTFEEGGEPSLHDVLQSVEKVPDLKSIKVGVVMSRVLEFEPGEFIREYAEILEVEQYDNKMESLTVEFQNGEFASECLTLDTSTWDELWRNLSGWEIEE